MILALKLAVSGGLCDSMRKQNERKQLQYNKELSMQLKR